MARFDLPASRATRKGRTGIAPMRPLGGAPFIRSAAALAVTLAVTACAAPGSAPSVGGQAEVVAANTQSVTDVEQVSIRANPTADRIVCRKTEPTGSRISVRRCESTSSGDGAADKMAHDQMLRDVEEMRMQELRRQQARQDAEAAMMRGRPPP